MAEGQDGPLTWQGALTFCLSAKQYVDWVEKRWVGRSKPRWSHDLTSLVSLS